MTAATMAHAAGLPITMSETWCKKISAAQLAGIVGALNDQAVDALGMFSFWAPLDQQYLQAVVNMSQAGQFLYVSPFWTELYFANLDYGVYGAQTTDQVMIAAQKAAGAARGSGSFSSVGLAWESMILASPDKTAPQVPAPPTIGQYSQTLAQVLWTPTTDNVGVAGYRVFRSHALITTLSQAAFTDNTLIPSTVYAYQLQAFDAAGNLSPMSAPATVTTRAIPDIIAPSVPANLRGTSVTDQELSLTWSPATDNVAVAGYHLFRGLSFSSLSLVAAVTTNSYIDTNSIRPNTTYYYAVEAFDPSYNYSALSAAIAVTALPDTMPPSVPTRLTAAGTGWQQVSMTWLASTDNIGVGAYAIYRGKTASSMTLVGNVTTTTFLDAVSLQPGTTYYYAVAAYDAARNYSAQTAPVIATTIADTQAPSKPQNLAVLAKSGTQINLTWSASTDNVAVYAYRVYRGISSVTLNLIGSSAVPSYTDTASLKANQTYYYAVAASDSSGNVSAESAVVSVVNP